MTPNLNECPACHTANPADARVCTRCSTPISAGKVGGPDKGSDLGAESNQRLQGASADPNSQIGGTLESLPSDSELTDLSAAQGWSQPAEDSSGFSRTGRLVPHRMLGKRFEIVDLLGEGGMGAVYKARDCELDRMVALKIIRPELAVNAQILARFKQELILARRITHKNVIRIFDLGEADGLKFITMEFVEGQDLSSLIREKGRLSFDQCAEVIYQTCSALDAAHSEGVVHRDLKPQNIMIDKNGRVVVMDFGIARTMEQRGMTQTGALIGTPDYMSPEQVMGEKVDARSDLFTLGIIFFQLLVGRLPYKADTIQGAMFKRTKETPQAPHLVDPTVPDLLSDIAAKCLQLDPQMRYQSALEIQHDIDAWRGGSTKRLELPVPPPTPEPVKAPWWKTPAVLIPAAFVLLTAGGVLVGSRFSSRAPSKPPKPAPPVASLAILPFHNASGNSKLDWLGSSMAEMLSTDVGQSASVRMVSEDRVEQVLKDLRITPQSEIEPATITRVANQSNVDTVVWGHYAQFGDRIRIDATVQDMKRGTTKNLSVEAGNENEILPTIDGLAGQIRQSLSVSSSLQKELQDQAFKPSTASVAALRNYNEGLQYARQGNYSQAAKGFQTALQDDSNFALAYAKLSQAYSQMGHDDDAEQAAQKAVSLSAQLPAQEKYLIQANYNSVLKDYPKAIDAYQNLVNVAPDNTDYLSDLGTAYEQTANYEKAKEQFARVVELDPKRVESLLALGRVKVESGDTAGGLEDLTKAQAIAVEVGDDAGRAQVLQAMGVAYYVIPRYDDALKSFNESLEIKKRLDMKKGIADSLEMIATVQDLTGKSNLAYKNYTQALSIMKDIGDKQGTGDLLVDLGAFQQEHGKYDEALKLFKESLQIQIDTHNEVNQGLALSNIGNAYLAKGDFDNARTYFAQALEVREKLKVPGDIADTLHNLAETSMKTGQFDQAQEQYLEALQLRRENSDQKGAAIESSGMGVVFAYQGRYGAAIAAQQDAYKGFQESNEQGSMATDILLNYGNALALAGRSDEAAKYLSEALNLAREQKNDPEIAAALSSQADNAFYRGDFGLAAKLYADALQTGAKTGDTQVILRTKISMVRLAVQQGKYSSALRNLSGLGEEADSSGLKYLSIVCLLLRGEALIGMKDYAGAQKELRSAALRSEKLGLRVLQAQAHFELARALELSGEKSAADAEYQEATRKAADILKEAQTDAVKKRSDLVAVFALKA
jgi:eukaryotic-like serine/threonine-protein kinase